MRSTPTIRPIPVYVGPLAILAGFALLLANGTLPFGWLAVVAGGVLVIAGVFAPIFRLSGNAAAEADAATVKARLLGILAARADALARAEVAQRSVVRPTARPPGATAAQGLGRANVVSTLDQTPLVPAPETAGAILLVKDPTHGWLALPHPVIPGWGEEASLEAPGPLPGLVVVGEGRLVPVAREEADEFADVALDMPNGGQVIVRVRRSDVGNLSMGRGQKVE
jgi:hypothetical protein